MLVRKDSTVFGVARRGKMQKMPKQATSVGPLKDGDACVVTAGTHAGKSGTVRDINTSKSGAVTITVVQINGDRVKTLAKNVSRKAR